MEKTQNYDRASKIFDKYYKVRPDGKSDYANKLEKNHVRITGNPRIASRYITIGANFLIGE